MLRFPDVEAITRTYLLDSLSGKYPGISVSTRTPPSTVWTTNPTLIVFTVAGGGGEVGRVFQSLLLGFECYAPSTVLASDLARDVQAHIEHWQYLTSDVAGVNTNAFPANSTDPDTGYPSYWVSMNLMLRATEVPNPS